MRTSALADTSFRKRLVAVVVLSLLAGGAAWAAAPAGRFTYPGGTVAASAVVYDTVTQLTWQRTPPTTTYTYSGAQGYCTGLNTTIPLLGGYSDWRLPGVKELSSIVDFREGNPAIDGTAFPETSSTSVWTNTLYTYRGSTGYAWLVNFTVGTTYGAAAPVGDTNAVRCVR